MKRILSTMGGGLAVLALGTAQAQEEPDPVVGSYLSDYVVEFVAGNVCEDLVQGGFVNTCESSQTVLLTSDGTILTQDNNASRDARSDAVGTWRKVNDQRYRTRLVTIFYDENSRVSGYDVTVTRFRLSANGRRSTGTFEVRNYSAEQDPFDANEIPQFVNTGRFETRKIR
ncbi:MAG: hypothetical protein AAF996_00005 [Pseudomonadota bacterium]